MSYTKVRNQSYNLNLRRSINFNPAADDFFIRQDNYSSTFTGDYNPSWRFQVKRGANATTTASGRMVTYDPGYLNATYVIRPIGNPDPATWGHGALIGTPLLVLPPTQLPVPDDVVAEVTNRSIRKFLDAYDSALSSIELGQDIGEIGATIRSIIHPLNSLREFTLSHLSKVLKLTKTVKHKASLTKMIADTFLEFKFGWNPLVADIGQAYADLVNNNHFQLTPIRGSAYREFPNTNIGWSTYVSLPNMVVQYSALVTGAYSVTLKGAVRCNAENGHIGFLQNMQLDLPHFVPTIWDLLPYSWIVDYFVNIGDIIKALSLNLANLAWGVRTTRITTNFSQSHQLVANNVPPLWEILSKDCFAVNPSGSLVLFSRTAISPGDLIPSVRISLPLGSEKPWENMAALLFGRQKEISRVASHLR
jgi:hypothetical protein